MTPTRPLKVFLCHASADKPAVRKLYRYLRSKGMDPWLDVEKLLPGESWELEIPKALSDSDVILVCISRNSVDKEGYVQKEITFALDKAKEKLDASIFIIPAKLEQCNIPTRLRPYQWVDLYHDDGRKRLMLSLNKRAEQLVPAVEQAVVTDDTSEREKLYFETKEKLANEKTKHDATEKAELKKTDSSAVDKLNHEAEEHKKAKRFQDAVSSRVAKPKKTSNKILPIALSSFGLLLITSIIVVVVIFAKNFPYSTNSPVAILPISCTIEMGERVTLTLDGQIPANTNIQWTTSVGDIVWTGQGLTATFFAPNNPGEATITVSFVSGTSTTYSTSRTCLITISSSLIHSLPSVTVNSPSPTYSVVISEIMGNPCGDLASNKFNQYVELYNYGEQPVDVGGWWLFDEGEKGTPDKLVTWDSRSTNRFNPNLITNTTVIPAQSFAVIISPTYVDSDIAQRMPYNFPANTIILTVESSQTLGDDFFGIQSSENGYDTLTLYVGSASVMDLVVDTYGTPKITSSYPVDINDDYLDHTPLYLNECEAAERVNPLLPDSETNWVTLFGGSPGDGPYK